MRALLVGLAVPQILGCAASEPPAPPVVALVIPSVAPPAPTLVGTTVPPAPVPIDPCGDPVEGVWTALQHLPAPRGEWYEYTLEVKRAAPGASELTGTIWSHYWYGEEEDRTPPPCGTRPRSYEAIIKMAGAGKLEGTHVQFGANTYVVHKVLCGGANLYNPDTFEGTLDTAAHEIDALSNDGHTTVNEPATFHRVRCLDK
jgi:hypothetical protein